MVTAKFGINCYKRNNNKFQNKKQTETKWKKKKKNKSVVILKLRSPNGYVLVYFLS